MAHIGDRLHNGVLSDRVILPENTRRGIPVTVRVGREGVGIQNGFFNYRFMRRIIRITRKLIPIIITESQIICGQHLILPVNRVFLMS